MTKQEKLEVEISNLICDYEWEDGVDVESVKFKVVKNVRTVEVTLDD